MRCVLDTNVLIEQLKNPTLPPPQFFGEYVTSVICEAEILRFSGMDVVELQAIEEFLSALRIVPVDSWIARRAAELGRTRSIDLPDLLIAATALELGVPLVTRNAKDFRKIPGLKVRSTFSK